MNRVEDSPSALYCGLLRPTGELVYGLGDFDMHTQITTTYVRILGGRADELYNDYTFSAV